MPIRKSLYTYLVSQGMVGSRVYQNLYPQNPTYPLIRLQKLPRDSQHNYELTGSNEMEASIQIDVFADTYQVAAEKAQAVKDALVDFSGAMGDETVQEIQVDTEADFFHDDLGIHIVTLTISIWYN